MQAGSELKRILHARSTRSVLSRECTVETVRDDPDGERFTLRIQVPIARSSDLYTFELGSIHASATPQQLDAVISGAVIAARKCDQEAAVGDDGQRELNDPPGIVSLGEKSGIPAPTQNDENANSEPDSSPMLEHNVSGYRSSVRDDDRLKVYLFPSDNTDSVFQINGLKQWHPNACGYHALYNAYLALYAVEGDGLEIDIRERPEAEFWAFVFRGMNRLKERRNETGYWSSSRLERGTLDQAHLEYLVSTDSILCNRVSVVDYEECLPVALNKQRHTKQRHAYILACSSHWICGALIGERRFLVMDSHNKPLTSLLSAEMSFQVANMTVEEYRPIFRSRMKEVDRYQHYPDQVLDKLYDDGIPEYWKGQIKDKMWWIHRPARTRVEILFRELEHAREYIETVIRIMSSDDISSKATKLERKRTILPQRVKTRPFQASPGVFTNLTSEEPSLTGYVRRDEELVEGDMGYDPTAPPSIQNRKRPPPPEIKGDAFDRQRVIPGFDQGTIEHQSCLVVGTGGIGMNVALTLARLGVAEICLVDYDVYDASNLTRQCLGTRADVGLKKTDVALRNIQAHNLRTKVRILEADIIKEWDKVVAAARRCTVIFNCCDAGLMLDYALNAISKEFHIPLCCGQSFGWKYMSEFYTGLPEDNCAFCVESTRTTYSCHAVEPVWRRFSSHPRFLSSFMDETALPAAINESHIQFLDQFFSEDEAFRFVPGSLREILTKNQSLFPFPHSIETLQAFISSLHGLVIGLMLPGSISKQQHLGFVARPKTPSTRYVGSWVCPCLACGVTCVSHWSQYLTGPNPNNRNPPTCILFNMDEGMTADEQMAYDCGISLDRQNRSFAKTPSHASCAVCAAAQQLKLRQDLYFGSCEVFLRPVMGEGEQVSIKPGWMSDISSEALEESKQRVLDLKDINQIQAPDGRRILVPFIPSADPIVADAKLDLPFESEIWPFFELGNIPLVKSSKDDAMEWPGTIRGVASGVRSAVVPMLKKGKCYRFKGCGNNTEGFPLEVKGEDGISLSLRGCMFEHTAARELYMSEYIQLVCNVNCGNTPIGFYKYPNHLPPTKNPNWKWEVPQLEKYCAIFETRGEKRLGDHLLNGLERLVAILVPDSPEIEDNIKSFLHSEGRWNRETDECWDTAMQVECGKPTVDCSRMEMPESREQLLDASHLQKLSRYRDLWIETARSFSTQQTSEDEATNLLLPLAKILGFECGTALRKMGECGVSFGTYPDELGIHCNAHANNFVVDAFSDTSFLAAVDFDMAFTRESFVPNCWSGKDAFFPKDFDGIVQFEQTMGMETSLAGSDFTSTGVTNANISANQSHSFFKLLRVLFRDTIVKGYRSGLNNEPPSQPTEKWVAQAHAVITLALIAQEEAL